MHKGYYIAKIMLALGLNSWLFHAVRCP